MRKNQGEVEDAILATTENIVGISYDMKDELDVHNKLLTDVTRSVEIHRSGLIKLNSE